MLKKNINTLILATSTFLVQISSFGKEVSLEGNFSVRLQDGKASLIALPGTLSDAELGTKATQATYGALTPKYQYIGKAIYTRKIKVTEEMLNKPYELFLERVLWKSTVTFDQQNLGEFDSFATPHIYPIPENLWTEGEHTLTIEIDNSRIYKITDKGHAYGDSMQTRWNGIIGKMVLRPTPNWTSVKIDAPYPATQLTIDFSTEEVANSYQVSLLNADRKTIAKQTLKPTKTGEKSFRLIQPLPAKKIKPWDEFSPYLYRVVVHKGKEIVFDKKIGFRTFTRKGNRLFVNGKSLFIRGNLDNCHFPLTGYPAMDKNAWVRIMKISKANGLNAIRFHSWCPPQAAFDAADEVGIYLSPEAGIWIDGWMAGKGFPEVKGLGKGDQLVDTFVQNELLRILTTYGNAPSFMALCIGNELGSSDFNVLGNWMETCKKQFPNHLYSASTARSISKADDFLVTHAYPGIGMIRERQNPFTNWDYEKEFCRTQLPTISHEIGQWPVYPDWDEINKYTGLLRPWNLEKLRDESKKNNTYRFHKRFHTSSLKTNRLMYKDEIESFYRTPSCSGLHLLGIQDYSGQGEALIGWLDSFYDEKKGLEKAPQIEQFFAPIVGLARFDKYTWQVGETFEATLLLRNQGNKPITQGTKFKVKLGSFQQILTNKKEIKIGELFDFGKIQVHLTAEMTGKKQCLTFAGNEWNIWVYPQQQATSLTKNILFTDQFDDALKGLQDGKKVLYNAYLAGKKQTTFRSSFRPVYWSTTWFPGQANITLGLWIDAQHPAFNLFPTEDWQDWQWFHLVNSGKNFILKDLPKDYTPIIIPIDDFHRNRFGAALFEVAVGKGQLLVCGYNLNQDRPEARQLKTSLLTYLSSTKFDPKTQVSEEWLIDLLSNSNNRLLPRPKEYKDAVVYMECAAKLADMNRDVPWQKQCDRAELTAGDYQVSGDHFRTWRDDDGSYWVANKMTITFKNTPQLRGKLLVRFQDPNRANRAAKGVFEGRSFTVPLHQDNQGGNYWLTLPVDMEDGLDGKLILEIEKTSGPNIMIDRIIYMPHS